MVRDEERSWARERHRAGHAGAGRAALFSFPNPVNEVSARLVAGGVLVMCVLTIAFDLRWATIVLAYGFVARVLSGPTLSPLGQFVTRVVTPRLGLPERPVAGPPKRFAQGMGVAFSVTALVLTACGYWTAAEVVLGLLAGAAFLESVFGLCLGCKVFACSCASAWCPRRSASAATTSGATRPQPHRRAPQARRPGV